MKFNIFPKKTREEVVSGQTDLLLASMIYSDDKLTELEMVQILNNARRGLSDYLKLKKNESMEQSTNFSQKAIEIQNALEYIE